MEIAEMPAVLPGEPSWREVVNSQPPVGLPVFYRTAHYQMLGYLDRFGRWIGSDGEEEPLPVEWWREVRSGQA